MSGRDAAAGPRSHTPRPTREDMPLRIEARSAPALPRLSWVAELQRDQGVVRVLHGTSVEARPDFVVEGAWDGPFREGGFHRAENFFGSGLRTEGDALWLVPSRALTDRLVYCVRGRNVVASNSVALLLGYTGARLDPDHDYTHQTFAVLGGIVKYDPVFPVLHEQIGEFRQLFHHPAVVRPDGVENVPPHAPVAFSSYEEYVERMGTALRALRENYTSPDRRVRLHAFSTISRGYDSPAATALVRDQVDACFTSPRSNSRIPAWISRDAADDDGSPIAERLGLPVEHLDPRSGGITEDELFFLAPTMQHPELIFHSMCRHVERHCEAAVVFSGYHGDKLWDVSTSGAYLSDEIIRGDPSGLPLSEIRLKSGFVQVPIPLMYARSIRDLVAISHSPEMSPWRLHNGYDRPIPRRILEEAGIPRNLFGQYKKAVIRQYLYPRHAGLRKAFFAHLRRRHGRVWAVHFKSAANRVGFVVGALAERVGHAVFRTRDRQVPKTFFFREVDLPYEMHVWALEELAGRYRGWLQAADGKPA